jgi:hypothetical protein
MKRSTKYLMSTISFAVIAFFSGCSSKKQVEEELKVQRVELANQALAIAKLQGELSEAQAQKQLLEQVRTFVETLKDDKLAAKVMGVWEIYSRIDPQADRLRYVMELRPNGSGKTLESYVDRPAAEAAQPLDPYGLAAVARPVSGTRALVKKQAGFSVTEIQWKIVDGKVSIEHKNFQYGRYVGALVVVGPEEFLLGLDEKGGGFIARRSLLKNSVRDQPKVPPVK